MTAETLRKAAALMRERAKPARAGSWFAEGAEIFAEWEHAPRYIAVCDASIPEGNRANAEHIASWHPGVALAVADWLDACVRRPNFAITEALAVATAYLGGEQ